MNRSYTLLIAIAVFAAGVLAFPAPANADPGDLVCVPPSSSTTIYDPPITLAPQDVTVHLTNLYGPCTSQTMPEVTSGISSATFPATDRSCLTLTGSGGGTETITWNTGQTSTVTLNFLASIVGGVFTVTITGVVTDGLFQGDTVVRNHTGVGADILLCQAGLGSVSSVATVGTTVFTSL